MPYSLETKKTFHSCLYTDNILAHFMKWETHDLVVYTKQKHSVSPGPRAREVDAATRGESYSYTVDKFWVIKQLIEDGQLLLITRTGKQHAIHQNDPNLRKATLWERWYYRQRYREIEALLSKKK